MLFVNNDRTCSQVPTLGLPALTGPQQALAPQASLQTALQQQLAASAALGENNMFLHISVYIVKWFFLSSTLHQKHIWQAGLLPGGYGKLIGAGGSPGMSSHRYSPYSLPSFNSGAAMAAGLSGAHQVHPQVACLDLFWEKSPVTPEKSPVLTTVTPVSIPSWCSLRLVWLVEGCNSTPSPLRWCRRRRPPRWIWCHHRWCWRPEPQMPQLSWRLF